MTTERFLTAPFRASFPSIFKKTKVPDTDEEPKYKITMLFDKADKEVVRFKKKFDKYVQEEIREKFGKKKPKKLALCIHDGDDDEWLEATDGVSEGMWIVKASSKDKPDVIKRNGDICTPEDFYAGVYARASVVLRAYDVGTKGVACHFNNFLKWEDGEPFGQGKSKAKDDFAEYMDEDGYDDEGEDEDVDI